MSDLQTLLGEMTRLLDTAGVPFMIAGSFASTTHGLPRTTYDVDIVIDPPDARALESFVRSMDPNVLYVDVDAALDALRRRSMFNAIDQRSGWKIDFMLRKDRPFSREEFGRRLRLTVLGIDVFIASPEDTIIAKLEWSKLSGGSERQRRDIAGIVATIGAQLDDAYIERWVRDLSLSDEWKEAQKTPT